MKIRVGKRRRNGSQVSEGIEARWDKLDNMIKRLTTINEQEVRYTGQLSNAERDVQISKESELLEATSTRLNRAKESQDDPEFLALTKAHYDNVLRRYKARVLNAAQQEGIQGTSL